MIQLVATTIEVTGMNGGRIAYRLVDFEETYLDENQEHIEGLSEFMDRFRAYFNIDYGYYIWIVDVFGSEPQPIRDYEWWLHTSKNFPNALWRPVFSEEQTRRWAASVKF